MSGLYDLIDEAMANELGVDVETYVRVIEERCTLEEADFIIENIWQEEGNREAAKGLFDSKLGPQSRD